MTGEAAAVPPRAAGIMPSAVKVTEIQNRLCAFVITLGSFDGWGLAVAGFSQRPGLFSNRFREQHRFRGNHPHR